VYIYPDNLKSKATLWLWTLRDLAIIGIGSLISVFALSQPFLVPVHRLPHRSFGGKDIAAVQHFQTQRTGIAADLTLSDFHLYRQIPLFQNLSPF